MVCGSVCWAITSNGAYSLNHGSIRLESTSGGMQALNCVTYAAKYDPIVWKFLKKTAVGIKWLIQRLIGKHFKRMCILLAF